MPERTELAVSWAAWRWALVRPPDWMVSWCHAEAGRADGLGGDAGDVAETLLAGVGLARSDDDAGVTYSGGRSSGVGQSDFLVGQAVPTNSRRSGASTA